MLSDRDLAQALMQTQSLERILLTYAQSEDLPERDQAINTMRLVKPLRRSLETWISVRALRAQMTAPSAVSS